MGKQFEGREAGRTQEGGGAGVCTLMHRKDPFVKKNEVGQVFIVTSASERTASRKCFFFYQDALWPKIFKNTNMN